MMIESKLYCYFHLNIDNMRFSWDVCTFNNMSLKSPKECEFCPCFMPFEIADKVIRKQIVNEADRRIIEMINKRMGE